MYYCTYLANHRPELVNVMQLDGSTSFGPPCRRKSIHLYTFASSCLSGTQDSDITSISEPSRNRSHTLTYDNIPWKDAPFLKSPSTFSWSCPSTKVPPFFIVWPVIKFPSSCFIKPSLKIAHIPEFSVQTRQMWCHAPSMAVTFALLQWNKNNTTSHFAARSCFLEINSWVLQWILSFFT